MKQDLIKRVRQAGWFVDPITGNTSFIVSRIFGKKYIRKVEVMLEKSGDYYDIVDKALKYKYVNKLAHFISKTKEMRFSSSKQNLKSFFTMAKKTGLIESLAKDARRPYLVNKNHKKRGKAGVDDRRNELNGIYS